MTWPELLEHMDNLSEWGHGELKAWSKQASELQKSASGLHEQGKDTEEACLAEDLTHRMQVQNKLAGVCVDMCKEVGAYPKCTCPDFVPPDSTPGVMTWPELLEHMDNLSEWGHGELKSWSQQASSFVGLHAQGAQSEEACLAEDLSHRMQVQNKLAGVCVDMCKVRRARKLASLRTSRIACRCRTSWPVSAWTCAKKLVPIRNAPAPTSYLLTRPQA